MKTNLVVMVVVGFFTLCSVAMAKDKPVIKKCDPKDTECLAKSNTAVNDSQNRGIRALEEKDKEQDAKLVELGLADDAMANGLDEAKCATKNLDGSLNPACVANAHPLVKAVGVVLEDNASQDRELAKAKADLDALKKAQRYFARAKDLKSATDRIRTLEEARAALPADLVGKAEIETMITRAQTASKEQVDVAIEALQKGLGDRVNQIEDRVTKLEGRVVEVEDRVTDVERQLRKRVLRMDMFTNVIMSNGVNAFGAGLGLEAPLGDGGWKLRPQAWFGQAEEGFGWGITLQMDHKVAKWLSLGFGFMYAQDSAEFQGAQEQLYAVAFALRAQWGRVHLALLPFMGAVGEKPEENEAPHADWGFGIGTTVNLGITFF